MKKIKNKFQQEALSITLHLTVARAAQSVERLPTAEREVAVHYSRGRTNTQGLKE